MTADRVIFSRSRHGTITFHMIGGTRGGHTAGIDVILTATILHYSINIHMTLLSRNKTRILSLRSCSTLLVITCHFPLRCRGSLRGLNRPGAGLSGIGPHSKTFRSKYGNLVEFGRRQTAWMREKSQQYLRADSPFRAAASASGR